MASSSRRLRAFKRWMISKSFEWSDAIEFTDYPEEGGIAVKAVGDLKEGEVVATIPKLACLTIKTSGACEIIEAAELVGYLGLSVAIMYERSLGMESPWFEYLQLLPQSECLPLVWSLDEVDELLCGTELHKTVKEDKALIYEDWKENILPLVQSEDSTLNPQCFGVEQYFAAKSLVASRSFEIDDYHGIGMVPLADLFNHKTGAEDVHITGASSHSDSDDDDSNNSDIYDGDAEDAGDDKPSTNLEHSSANDDDRNVLEMIMVKDVKAGAEVFNTYGLVGNAALLHRYGFTEPDNLFDIVNIDLELVLSWSSSLFTSRCNRARLALWRKLGYSGCVSENSEYFEISSEGEPQIELLILLYMMLLTEEAYHKLDLAVSTDNNMKSPISIIVSGEFDTALDKGSEITKDLLLTESVCSALLWLADKRESMYGSNSMEDDIQALKDCCCITERKRYHSLQLRVSERRILNKLRSFAHARISSSKHCEQNQSTKRIKKA